VPCAAEANKRPRYRSLSKTSRVPQGLFGGHTPCRPHARDVPPAPKLFRVKAVPPAVVSFLYGTVRERLKGGERKTPRITDREKPLIKDT